MTSRRTFIKQAAAAGIAGTFPGMFLPRQQESSGKLIWAYLIHLSYNMWEDNVPPKYRDEDYKCTSCQEAREWAHGFRPNLTFDYEVWDALLPEMAAAGINMVVIDLGDGVEYESHPEIAVKNAWKPEKLRNELSRMRKLGIEPIPKLNFATTHDIWMKEYSRMVSTDIYYAVCRDLIREVTELFDRPRFFHLGMDEELASYQTRFDYAVVRQNDLWWGDLYFLIGEVEKNGVRPWVWSDYAWHKPDVFFRKMPRSVLQSNWYYYQDFDLNKMKEPLKTYVKLYNDLEKHGYDQVPTGSNHSVNVNFERTVEYCKKVTDPSRLYGFMTAPWRPTLIPCLGRHREAIAELSRAMKKFYPAFR
ncbi:MAG TPA: twin-arginine translocation signal domain-containing protein [Bacteroidales bacterium]|jgi:hypothetical protein|nr:twin-arginine translocation signal domain-containing protein [Bacteroidales bacterium]HOS72155.1 twin-arginine translocation signal domain-containing protein [Bacteroidales bacterium]HQH25586.1 twin-arginine translocation signal domain-containing protein [Bacteroidales bacterium]HQJ83470.1 twin-arginine translocation signal domain-containing protein [Bacteroidales bacterium]